MNFHRHRKLPTEFDYTMVEHGHPCFQPNSHAGTIYLGEDAVPPGQLGAALATASEGVACSQREVVLRADKTLDYGRVMGVMGELNRMGCNSISLVTNSSSESL